MVRAARHRRRLTCSDYPLDLDAGGVQLLGELVDGSVRVLVGLRVDVGFGAWKFDWVGWGWGVRKGKRITV